MIKPEECKKLKEILTELAEKSKNGSIIIVEGINDLKSLREIGIKGKIFTSSNTPNVELVDQIGRKDVIILTDNDRTGNILEKNLKSKFSTWGVNANTEFKRKIFSIVSKEIYSIEELAFLCQKIENGKNSQCGV